MKLSRPRMIGRSPLGRTALLSLLLAAGSACAVELGNPPRLPRAGEALFLSLPLRLAPGELLRSDCITVRARDGRQALDGLRLRLGGRHDAPVLIVAADAVLSAPTLSLRVQIACRGEGAVLSRLDRELQWTLAAVPAVLSIGELPVAAPPGPARAPGAGVTGPSASAPRAPAESPAPPRRVPAASPPGLTLDALQRTGLILVAGLLLVLVGMVWRRRRDLPKPSAFDLDALRFTRPSPMGPPGLSPGGESAFAPSTRADVGPAPGQLPGGAVAPGAPPTTGPRRGDVSADELIDLDQQVEFFLALGQDEAAMALLNDHLEAAGVPLPHLRLGGILRRRGERAAWEALRSRTEARFNLRWPAWEAGPEQGETLDDHPEALARLVALWPTPGRAAATLGKSLLRPADGSPRRRFGLRAYQELMLLHAIARDVAERVCVDAVDLELPMDDPLRPPPVVGRDKLMATTPLAVPSALLSGTAAPIRVDVMLDLDLPPPPAAGRFGELPLPGAGPGSAGEAPVDVTDPRAWAAAPGPAAGLAEPLPLSFPAAGSADPATTSPPAALPPLG